MKVLYSYTNNAKIISIKESNGVQRVLLVFKDNNDSFVYFCDDYLRTTYLNKIINPTLAEPFCISNFKRIDTDEEFFHYTKLIENSYNYNGVHLEEKITGHDQGGAVLIDPLTGKALI